MPSLAFGLTRVWDPADGSKSLTSRAHRSHWESEICTVCDAWAPDRIRAAYESDNRPLPGTYARARWRPIA